MTRIAVVGLAREGNTFGGGVGTIDDFRRGTWLEGEHIFDILGRNDSMAGAIEVAREREVEVVPVFMARSTSGPSVTKQTHEELRSRVLDGLTAVVDEVDGVYVRLHGAMTAEGCDDVEGDLLTRIRELIGDRPMSASFDLHSHFTAQMAASTPLLAGFLTYPHVDMADTGRRAMTLLLDQLAGTVTAFGGYRQIPMMSASEAHNTTEGPIAEVMRMRDDLVERGELLDGSIFCTQPWLDLPGIGWSVVTVGSSPEAAQRWADHLAGELFDRRERCVVTKIPLADALAQAAAHGGKGGPVVLGDGADSPSAGSTGDSPEMLSAILAADFAGPAVCSVVDAPAVETCVTAGIGAEVTVQVGGSLSPHFFSPVEVTGIVATIVDGNAPVPMSGPPVTCGRAVILQIGRVSCVISEYPTSMVDDRLYHRMGIDVTAAWVVQAKSAGQYRDGYAHQAAEMIDVDMRGPSQHNLLTLPWQRATHAWWPKDPEVSRGF